MEQIPHKVVAKLALTGMLALGAFTLQEASPWHNAETGVIAYADNATLEPSPLNSPILTPSPDATPSDTPTATIAPSYSPSPSFSPSPSSAPVAPKPTLQNSLPIHGVHQQYLQQFRVDGHSMDVFVPGDDTPRALVLIQHRLYGYPQEAEASTQLIGEAAIHKWLLVYPNGYGSSWNAKKCCGEARDTNQPDIQFVQDTITTLRHKYKLGAKVPTIDGGISNGGMLAARLYCKRPGLIDAAILDSANLEDPSCQVAHVNNLLMMRGAADILVKVNGNPYSQFLGTSLLADSFTIDSFKRGSVCNKVYDVNSEGIHSTVTRCGSRILKYVLGQGSHKWQNRARPGIPNETKLATDFIVGVTIAKQRS